MSNIPTAEEFLASKLGKTPIGILPSVLIEFAKLHVEAALKAVVCNVEIDKYDEHGQYNPTVNEKSVLNAYPLDNIK